MLKINFSLQITRESPYLLLKEVEREMVLKLASAKTIWALIICGVFMTPAFAETRPPADTVANLWEKIEKEDFETERDFYLAVQKMAAQSDEAIAFLSPELPAAENDDQRVTITYVLGLATQHQKMREERDVELSPNLVAELKQILHTTDEIMLQANIVNIALMMETRAEPLADEMIAVLKKSNDPGLRATTTIAIGRIGDMVFPRLYEEIKQSEDPRFVGDIALLLRDRDVPPDIVATLKRHALAGDAQTRQQLLKVLIDLEKDKSQLIPIMLSNLEKSETSRQRLMAVYTLQEAAPPADVMIDALKRTIEKLDPNGDEADRVEIINLLMRVGDDGVRAVAAAIAQARTEKEKAELVQWLSRRPINDPAVINALMNVATKSEDRILAQAALTGLTRIGSPAVPAIDAAIETAQNDEVKRDLETTRVIIRTKEQ